MVVRETVIGYWCDEMASENSRSNSIVGAVNGSNPAMDVNNVSSSLFNSSHYRSYSPYSNNSFYLNPASACSSVQYDPNIHASQSSHHHHTQQTFPHSQYTAAAASASTTHPHAQNSSLDYFRAIQTYGYSAFSRDIDKDNKISGNVNSNKSQSSNNNGEVSIQNERENVRTLIGNSQQSDALSDDIIEESFESDYDDEDEDSTRTSQNKTSRNVRPTSIYISPTAVLHSSVPNNDWARAVSEHFQRSFSLTKGSNENFFAGGKEFF